MVLDKIRKGSVYLMVAIAAVVVGGLLIWGIKSAGKPQSISTTATTTTVVVEPSVTMFPTTGTVKPKQITDADLGRVDQVLGTAPEVLLSVDSAINDKPIDDGK